MGERVPLAYGGPCLPHRQVARLSFVPAGAGVVVAETRKSAKSAGWAGSSHREARGLSTFKLPKREDGSHGLLSLPVGKHVLIAVHFKDQAVLWSYTPIR